MSRGSPCCDSVTTNEIGVWNKIIAQWRDHDVLLAARLDALKTCFVLGWRCILKNFTEDHGTFHHVQSRCWQFHRTASLDGCFGLHSPILSLTATKTRRQRQSQRFSDDPVTLLDGQTSRKDIGLRA
ncbi:hypothetical protein DTO282F9_5323 [Paecilomyces variotii]|nr:hypothetical protein DTO282F9_5323 [Paecilomyces variotii]